MSFKRCPPQFYLGSIWTLMIHYDENTKECQIRYGQDSNGNEVNIFLLVPQYVVITIGEVSYLPVILDFATKMFFFQFLGYEQCNRFRIRLYTSSTINEICCPIVLAFNNLCW